MLLFIISTFSSHKCAKLRQDAFQICISNESPLLCWNVYCMQKWRRRGRRTLHRTVFLIRNKAQRIKHVGIHRSTIQIPQVHIELFRYIYAKDSNTLTPGAQKPTRTNILRIVDWKIDIALTNWTYPWISLLYEWYYRRLSWY